MRKSAILVGAFLVMIFFYLTVFDLQLRSIKLHFTRPAVAEERNPEADYKQGSLYIRSLPKKCVEGEKLISAAAGREHTEAIYELGRMYMKC